MKKHYNLRILFTCIIEIIIPIICIPILPFFFPKCTSIEAFIAGTCLSIFIAIWEFRYRFHEKSKDFLLFTNESKQNFDYVYQQLSFLQTIQKFSNSINNVSHPYFKKQICIELEKDIHEFEKSHRELFDQYIETTPYNSNTFGIEGLSWTENHIYAVSSIEDYWQRDNFINDYLDKQYFLIRNNKIEIERIFIMSKKKLKQIDSFLKKQKENGIKVYYIYSTSEYLNKDWINEDFLIQDNKLLVELQSKSHKYEKAGKEIITTDETLVLQKIQLFKKMLESANEY